MAETSVESRDGCGVFRAPQPIWNGVLELPASRRRKLYHASPSTQADRRPKTLPAARGAVSSWTHKVSSPLIKHPSYSPLTNGGPAEVMAHAGKQGNSEASGWSPSNRTGGWPRHKISAPDNWITHKPIVRFGYGLCDYASHSSLEICGR